MPPFGSMQGRFGGRSVPKRVDYVADSLGTGFSTAIQRVTIPAHFDGDLILVTCGSTTSTVPTLPVGWTNVILAVNTGSAQVRPMRMFYKISDGTLTTLDITTVTTIGLRGSGCMIFRNAVSVGAAAAYTDTVVNALARPFSALALQNTDGTSVVVGATYTQLITSIVAGSVPMTLGTIAGTTAIFARSNNVEAFAATNWNASTSAARISATVEVRGPIINKVWTSLDSTKTLVSDNDVSSWGGPIAFPQSVTANRPAYDPMTDLVTFSRTSGHFLNAGSQTLNIGTNGGFTAIFYFKYTGTGGTGERIFDFGSGAPTNNVLVHRLNATTNTFAFYITNGATAVVNNLSTAANVLVQNQFAVWAVRYRAYDLSAAIFKNDGVVASGTASALVTDRTCTMSFVGRPVTGWASPIDLNGSIQGLYVYDRALADEEITNLSIDKFGANFGAVRGYSLQRLFTTYAGPVVRVRRSSDSLEQAFWADTLSGTLMSSALAKRFTDLDAASRVLVGTEVSSWGSPIAFVGAAGTRPDYILADDVVRFSRANTDYLNGGAQSFPISTNGGFTAVVMARFSGTVGTVDTIFDFGSGATPGDNIALHRSGTSSDLRFRIRNGTSDVTGIAATGVILQNEMALFAVRYRKSDNSAQIYKNNELVASVTGLAAIPDRTVTATWIGRNQHIDSTLYFNGDIRGLYVYNYALTDSEIQSVILSKFGMPGVTGSEYDAFVGQGTGYISQLYDQTGQGYHATQATSTSQPWIVKKTGWTSQPTMRCGGVGYLSYDGATNALVNMDYTVAVTTSRTSNIAANYVLGGTAAVANQNFVIGYGNAASFRVNHFTSPDYSGSVPTYTVPLAETFTARHSSTFAKNLYRNGAFVASNVSTVALAAYAGAQIGRFQTSTPYYGDISSILMFNSYLSDRRRQIVEADLAGLLGSPATYAPLDIISESAKSTCVAAYSLRQASAIYTGAIVRLQRPSDSVEADFTASQFDSGDVATWAGAETPTVTTLYDQSGGGNHLTQATVANQPSLVVSDRAIRFDQTSVSKTLRRSWNVFGASTLSQMHMVSVSKENSRGTNKFFEFTYTGGTRFALHAPYSDGIWYWDIGNTGAATGRASGATSVVGETTFFSGYKDPTTSLTGYRLNGGTTYASTGGTSTMTTTGIILGGTQPDDATSPSHDFFEWLIFSARLPIPDEIALEVAMQNLI